VQPTFFLTHGGGPSFFIDVPEGHFMYPISRNSVNAQWLRDFTKTYNLQGASAPKAIVVVSAHWVTSGKKVRVSYQAQHDKLLYDYSGFPKETYELQFKPRGDLKLSERIVGLLQGAGLKAELDPKWNFDHGVFVPLKMIWPEAEVPVVELSIDRSYDPAWHVAVGEALAQLKHEGVLVIGSGSSTHNFHPIDKDNKQFMAALTEAVERPVLRDGETTAAASRTRVLALEWEKLPSARQAHPEEDHLVPLFVALGAAKDQNKGRVVGRVPPPWSWHTGSVIFE